jgi:hypothetical protein
VAFGSSRYPFFSLEATSFSASIRASLSLLKDFDWRCPSVPIRPKWTAWAAPSTEMFQNLLDDPSLKIRRGFIQVRSYCGPTFRPSGCRSKCSYLATFATWPVSGVPGMLLRLVQ